MSQTIPTNRILHEIGATLKTRWRWWCVPTVVLTAAALAYGVTRPKLWEASQALVVRDEALGAANRQGRFDSADAMKTTQETVLEVARNRRVVSTALAQIPPPAGCKDPAQWPSDRDVEEAADQIMVRAPRGSEFGRTEVIYLAVRRPDPEEAGALAQAMCHQIEVFWQELRKAKAQSLIAELSQTASLSQAGLDAATRQLEAMEKELGSDLGEMRTLNEQGSGDSNLRTGLNKIQEELRQAQAVHETRLQLQAQLSAALSSPDRVLAMPGQLLESQPALKRLKDGLVDAQLRKAEVMGRMSPDHPHVRTAALAEEQVRKDLRDELQVALRGVEADLKASGARVRSLEAQAADVRRRLDRLAGLRARYGNLVAEVRRNTEIVERTQKALADAKASQGAAQSASLITRPDGPQISSEPVGPSTAAITAGGFGCGLLTGVGLVFLVGPLGSLRGRRWTDYFPGRRASDRFQTDRRASDRSAPQTPIRAMEPSPLPAREPQPPSADRRNGTDRRGSGRSAQPAGS